MDGQKSTLGERIRQLRKERGLTQQQLATATGLSMSLISQLEQAVNLDPRGSTLLGIARALGVTVEWLLGEDDTPPKSKSNEPPAKGKAKKKGK